MEIDLPRVDDFSRRWPYALALVLEEHRQVTSELAQIIEGCEVLQEMQQHLAGEVVPTLRAEAREASAHLVGAIRGGTRQLQDLLNVIASREAASTAREEALEQQRAAFLAWREDEVCKVARAWVEINAARAVLKIEQAKPWWQHVVERIAS